MGLDMQTVIFMGAFVLMSAGAVLLVYWLLHRREWSALAFAAAMATEGAGVMLLAFHPTYVGPVWIPATLLFTASLALCWSGVQLLTTGRVGWTAIAVAGAGIVIPALASVLPFGLSGRAAGTFAFGIAYVAMAVAVLRLRDDSAWIRSALAGIFMVRSVAFFIHAVIIGPDEGAGLAVMGMLHLVTPFSAVGIATFLFLLLGQRREQRFRRDAEIDSLTGASNRRAFLRKAERLFARSHEGGEPIALLALDLDHFKRVNDVYGHPFGDEVLRVFSKSVQDGLRPGDLFGRIGGEEFVVLLPGCNEKVAGPIAQRIARSFSQVAETVNDTRVQATVSIGIAVGPAPTLAQLMSDADRALYQAKAQGRNRAILWQANHPIPAEHIDTRRATLSVVK